MAAATKLSRHGGAKNAENNRHETKLSVLADHYCSDQRSLPGSSICSEEWPTRFSNGRSVVANPERPISHLQARHTKSGYAPDVKTVHTANQINLFFRVICVRIDSTRWSTSGGEVDWPKACIPIRKTIVTNVIVRLWRRERDDARFNRSLQYSSFMKQSSTHFLSQTS
jgi:hypothetical protein